MYKVASFYHLFSCSLNTLQAIGSSRDNKNINYQQAAEQKMQFVQTNQQVLDQR